LEFNSYFAILARLLGLISEMKVLFVKYSGFREHRFRVFCLGIIVWCNIGIFFQKDDGFNPYLPSKVTWRRRFKDISRLRISGALANNQLASLITNHWDILR